MNWILDRKNIGAAFIIVGSAFFLGFGPALPFASGPLLILIGIALCCGDNFRL